MRSLSLSILFCWLIIPSNPIQAQDNYLGYLEVGFATAQPLVKSPDFKPTFSGIRFAGSRAISGPLKVVLSGAFLSDGTSRIFAGDVQNQTDRTILFKVDTGYATPDSFHTSSSYKKQTSQAIITVGLRYYFSELNAFNPFLGASVALMNVRPNNRNIAAATFQEIDSKLQRTNASGILLEGGFDWMISRGFSLIGSAQFIKSGKTYHRVSHVYQTTDMLTGQLELSELTVEEEPFSFFCVNISACFKIGLKKKK